MIKTKDYKLDQYCDVLAVKEPVPGGGSVCGVYGSIASSLVLMVLSYTIGKEKFETYREELESAKEFFRDLQDAFFSSSDEDIESYGKYSAGGQERDAAVVAMIETPLEAMSMAVEALELMSDIKDKTNPYLVNDFLLAQSSFLVVFRGAEHNLEYNLKSAKEHDFIAGVKEEYSDLQQRLDQLKLEI